MRFSNSGDAALTFELGSTAWWISISAGSAGSLSPGESGAVDFEVTCTDADLNGSVVLTTNDPDQGSVGVAVSVTCEPLTANYEIARVTLNQATRAYDSDTGGASSISLIQGRDLLVRAFVTGRGPVPDANVILSGTGQAEQSFPMQQPAGIDAVPAAESILSASHYVVIPGSSLQVGSRLVVEVDPANTGVQFPSGDSLRLDVRDPGSLQVTFVPVTFNGETPSIVAETYFRQTRQQLPIGNYDLEVRTPYLFNGTYDLDRLLDEMTDLRNVDGSPRLYHGIIEPQGRGSQTAGVAYVGFPVGVSIDLAGSQNVISHEIGHNLDLRHAPACDAPNADTGYPDPAGVVRQWGFDVHSRTLVRPDGSLTDLMGYCDDQWISRYSFVKALNFRLSAFFTRARAASDREGAQAGLAISGRLRHGVLERLSLLPVSNPRQLKHDDGSSELRFQAWDTNGLLLVDVGITLHQEEDHGSAPGFSVVVPHPGRPIHHYQIVENLNTIVAGQLVVEREFNVQPAAGVVPGVRWESSPSRTAIVRNETGEIITIDRSGITAAGSEGHSVEMVQNGMSYGRLTLKEISRYGATAYRLR